MKAGYRHIPPSWYKGAGGGGVKCKEVSLIKKTSYVCKFVAHSIIRSPIFDYFYFRKIDAKELKFLETVTIASQAWTTTKCMHSVLWRWEEI